MNYIYSHAWGVKRLCLSCNAKFYDLGRLPILCPKCQTEFIDVPRPKPIPRGSAKMHWGRIAGRQGRVAPIVADAAYPVTNAGATEDAEEEDEDSKHEEDDKADDEADESE